MPTITLIRHAQTVWNAPPRRFQGRRDVDLSDVGLAAARAAATELPPNAALFASPARRCVDTARALFPGRPDPTVIPDLWEIDVGECEGREVDAVAAENPEWWRRWRSTPSQVSFPGGESLLDLRARVLCGIATVIDLCDGDAVCVVHGGPMRIVRAVASGLPLDAFAEMEVANLQRDSYDAGELACAARIAERV